MLSLYSAYQAYEKRFANGEFDTTLPNQQRLKISSRPSFAFRLGDLLVRTGTKLKQRTLAGHALTSTTMAGK